MKESDIVRCLNLRNELYVTLRQTKTSVRQEKCFNLKRRGTRRGLLFLSRTNWAAQASPSLPSTRPGCHPSTPTDTANRMLAVNKSGPSGALAVAKVLMGRRDLSACICDNFSSPSSSSFSRGAGWGESDLQEEEASLDCHFGQQCRIEPVTIANAP